MSDKVWDEVMREPPAASAEEVRREAHDTCGCRRSCTLDGDFDCCAPGLGHCSCCKRRDNNRIPCRRPLHAAIDRAIATARKDERVKALEEAVTRLERGWTAYDVTVWLRQSLDAARADAGGD